MEVLGFTSEEIVNILKIVASVLKLGNICFVPSNNIDGTEGCTINNDYELYEVCEILETEANLLQGALTCRILDDSLDVVITELSATEATYARDSLCKALYSRLFTYLVNKINDSIKVKRHGKRKLLGILDVYGFEIFEKNGFEQFIINFCNEKLQQLIVNITLKEEQEDYIREGIDWVPIDFCENDLVCDLIEKNNHGILSMLDEECLNCARSDEFFLKKMASCFSGHSHLEVRRTLQRNFIASDNNLPHNCFRLKHFAGTVTYTVNGFVDKNRDILSRDISQAMYNSSHPLLKTLFPEGNPKRASVKVPATTGAQFKISISALVRNLTSKEPHYVRCIKPNELKQPRIFETALVQHQVHYLGLLETVRVRRQGFCYKLEYQVFLNRYKMLSLHTWPTWNHSSIVEGVKYLVRDLPIPKGEFAFGRTKIFVRSPRTVFELEEFRRERLYDLAVIIQKSWRRYRQRKYFLSLKRSQVVIAASWKSFKAREEYKCLKHRKQVLWAVTVIQRYFIGWKRRQFLNKLLVQLLPETESPICKEWPVSHPRLAETSQLLMKIHHKWRVRGQFWTANCSVYIQNNEDTRIPTGADKNS
ncbi:UNVERIFIED_CONTAM: hypothetical protein PYX00_008773 [Menopon gallinae]|uniref:Myosin motor domain-containing protein n=1 Tax=Menopon gallinae TaxID=328185 RepID=A0AAW2HPM2_9NEOP